MVVSLFKQMTTLVKASTLEFQNSISQRGLSEEPAHFLKLCALGQGLW